ncbi:MAG: hemin uptake protein HemP [Fuerstia sp.]|nr:hemin uptake protein HemP [Fuerstiella sp.]
MTGRRDGDGVSGQNPIVQRVVSFSQIAGGTTEVIIEHEGQQYRLRATRNGRLLLNK